MKKLLSFFTFVVLSTAFIALTPAANAGIEPETRTGKPGPVPKSIKTSFGMNWLIYS